MSSSLYPFSEKGDTDFDIGFVIINLLGTGIAFFVALEWQVAFQRLVDIWVNRHTEEEKKTLKKRITQAFVVAAISTLVAVLVSYLMYKGYNSSIRRKLKLKI